MIKDKVTSVRINTDIFIELEDMGLTVQQLVDEGIEKLFNIEVEEIITITVKDD